MSTEIIENVFNTKMQEYFVVPFLSKDDTIKYDIYKYRHDICLQDKYIIRVQEYDTMGKRGIPSCGVSIIERHMKLDFLGEWSPNCLNRDTSCIKRDKLFILPAIRSTISSIDEWQTFNQNELNDYRLWHNPRNNLHLKAEYNYIETTDEGVSSVKKREFDESFNLEILDPIESAICAIVILDSFESDQFDIRCFNDFINSIKRYNARQINSDDCLLYSAKKLERLYCNYVFLPLAFRDNLNEKIKGRISYLKMKISQLEQKARDLDWFD